MAIRTQYSVIDQGQPWSGLWLKFKKGSCAKSSQLTCTHPSTVYTASNRLLKSNQIVYPKRKQNPPHTMFGSARFQQILYFISFLIRNQTISTIQTVSFPLARWNSVVDSVLDVFAILVVWMLCTCLSKLRFVIVRYGQSLQGYKQSKLNWNDYNWNCRRSSNFLTVLACG